MYTAYMAVDWCGHFQCGAEMSTNGAEHSTALRSVRPTGRVHRTPEMYSGSLVVLVSRSLDGSSEDCEHIEHIEFTASFN